MKTAPSVSSRLIPLGVVGAEPRQVVVAELIDGDEQHQADIRTRNGLRRGQRDGERRECEGDGGKLFHQDL